MVLLGWECKTLKDESTYGQTIVNIFEFLKIELAARR